MAKPDQVSSSDATLKTILLVLNGLMLCLGNTGGPLVMRLYFFHGGKRVWLSSWLETAGWPFIAVPIALSYIHRRRQWASAGGGGPAPRLILMKPPLFVAATIVGVLTGLDDYLYAYGVARIPISTSALIIASQLAFTAGFAFLLVRQRFTPFSINSVFLLTLGAVVLALHTSSDRPNGESTREYIMGFGMTVAASALYGFVLPLVELSYKKAKQAMSYSLVLEFQLVMCFFATAFCTIGMVINNDFKVIPREAKEYEIGEFKYYMVLVFSAIAWQCFFLGAIGVIYCASSLTSGIIIAVLLPVTEILAVVFYKEKFTAEKGISLALSIWGSISYFYGEIKHPVNKNRSTNPNGDQSLQPESEMKGRSLLP